MFNKLLSILCVFTATGSILCMDKQTTQRLNFLLDEDLIFLSHSAEDMSYLTQPDEFLGKNLCDVLLLSDKDWANLVEGFSVAQYSSKTTTVSYALKEKIFLAEITALKKADKTHEFFVKITPR